jgi:hypothetical protein
MYSRKEMIILGAIVGTIWLGIVIGVILADIKFRK